MGPYVRISAMCRVASPWILWLAASPGPAPFSATRPLDDEKIFDGLHENYNGPVNTRYRLVHKDFLLGLAFWEPRCWLGTGFNDTLSLRLQTFGCYHERCIIMRYVCLSRKERHLALSLDYVHERLKEKKFNSTTVYLLILRNLFCIEQNSCYMGK